ncbi:diguanylate cyclase (GGDEF) domain-containing protein [Maridesulfovibrio ferrireducens]|uniref:diguanylate cyclase n=1 Tax=Maridesulfovibrio ferrireducens TaxID=246191 RepID=A0A1G9HLU3_9BACT|nr:GGDEF domain-containing protein [Maridesulfovibrio ferrireducens]SDL13714.1 diguanylate cyclase (GGDEF) domain-containing protein [Maridesulfovibrio ferrireducens]
MNAEYIAENEAYLLDELLSVRERFCDEKNVCFGKNCLDGLAILRLCPGMTLSAWKILAERHGLNDWMTIPLEENITPHLKHVQSVLQTLSYKTEHDPLTGLSNRRAFERTLDQEIERSRRNKTSVSLAILDLDNFKAVNDTYGHLKGDEVLIDLADMISNSSRRYDLVARIGGEEFAIILSGAGQFKAEQLLERLLEKTRTLTFKKPHGKETFSITCSIGLATYKGLIDIQMHDFIEKADKSLYEAKNTGKNRICTAKILDFESVTRETLVHANEKKFLFTGK